MYKDKKQERDFRGATNGKHFKQMCFSYILLL